MNAKYFYLLPLLFSALSLHAQQACLDFEDFPAGPAFGPVLNNTPGDTLFSQDGLIAIAREIQYLNGNTGFGNAAIEGANVNWLDGNFLFMGNNALELQYPNGVQQVCFDFFDGGGEENFSVNGSDVAVLTGFPDIAGIDFPGVEVTVTLDSSSNNTFLSAGTVCITGEVFSLLVGGQEFGVDNVCATPFDPTNSGNCLEFEMMDTLGYGAQAGTPPGTVFYTESDVAMRLAPVQTLFWSSVYGDLRVRQAADVAGFTQASGQFLEFASINSIYDFTAYPEPVEQVTVDYYYAPDGDGTINFAANGAALLIQFVLEPGFYPLAPGVTLEVVPDNNINSSGQLIFEGNVQSLLIGGVAGLHIDNVCINPPPPCALQELIVQAGDCNPNGVFEVTIDIEYDGLPTDTLQLFTNGNYQLYAAGDFPVTLSPFIAPTDDIEFKVSAFGQPDCFLTKVLPAQDCGADCTLESIVMEGDVQCFPGEDIYTIILVVEGAQEGDTLTVSAQETNYLETLIYNGQQLVLDLPLPAAQFEVLQICDFNANADCCKEISYDVGCADCVFDNLSIGFLPCDGDSLFYFELGFDALGNLPSESFKVETSNGFLETYAYADLPVTVGPVLGYGEPITVWAYDTEGDCGASQTIITPDCADGCVLDDVNLLIPAAGCNNDGTYNIPMTVGNAQNGDTLIVTSLITGYAKTLIYGEPFGFNLQLSNWPSPPSGVDSLSICFANQPDCCAYVDFEVPCDPADCGLEAMVEVIDCQPNGVLTFSVTTSNDNPNGGPFVMIRIGNTFSYGLVGVNTTVEVGPFINPGTDEIIVLVEQWANQSSNSVFCEVEVPVDVSGCNPDCAIPAFNVIPEGCTGIFGSYSAFIDLDEAALNGAPIDIFVNGDLRWSEYTGGDLSLDIWAINPGDVQDVISICYSENPECCISKGVDAIPCYCSDILNIVAEATPCDGDSYYVELDLVASDFGDFFNLEVDGAFYGSYTFSELPLTIGPFEGNGAPLHLFAYPDGQCQPAETSIETPVCNPGCDIEAVFADATDCNDDGKYNLVLDLEYSGVPTSFEVSIPGLGYSEVYGLNDFPVTIPGLPGDGETYQVNIGATDCNAFTEKLFDAPACNVGCIFNNVIAEPHPCEDGTFLVDIEVQVNDPGDLGYFIFADGEIFGPFDYSEPFVTLGPFAGDGVTVYDFLILDFANPTCFGYVEVGRKTCDNGGDCQILALSAIPQDCNGDGTYDLLLDIEVEEPQDDLLFWFYRNGVYSGQSTLAALPGLLINVPLENTDEITFKACIFDQPDCCMEVVFEVPDCLGPDGACLDFEPFAGFQSPPGDGTGELQEVGTQGGVFFGYSLGDFCLCSMEVIDSEDLNFFEQAEGQVVEFTDAELYFEFPEPAGEVSFDYSTQETDVYLTEDNFNALTLLDTLTENTLVTLPNGNTIKRIPYTNNNNFSEASLIVITGEVTVMRILGTGFLDNLCWSPATEEVWPGDANADNLAHHIDLLSIGLGYGVSGPARVDQDNSWSPTVSMNWDSTFADGTNYKHADCNGDGIIDEADRMVLMDNYGLSHGVPEPVTELPGTDLDPPAFINFPVDQPSGAAFQAPILIGSANAPVQNAYGVAFTVQFDPEVINPDEIEVVYPTSWFGEPGVNTLTVDKVYPDGRIEIALTRIDQNNVSGHGQVAYIIGIIDDIAGLTESEVSVEKTFCIDLEENRLPIQGQETIFKVVSNEEADSGSGVFTLFPNPATDWVNIVSPHGFEADQVQLLNMNGQELPVQMEDNRRLSLASLPSGVYLVRITTGRSIVHKRVVKE